MVSQVSVAQQGTGKPVARGNRRVSIRYRCAPATVGKILSADDQELQRAWILDLSLRGIGMETARPIEPGHLILITMRSADGARQFELSAIVRHCELSLQGSWNIGCELKVPLTPEELEQLL